MARLQLIFPLMFWALWRGTDGSASWRFVSPLIGTIAYFSALLSIVALMTWTARRAMRQTTFDRGDAVPRFHRAAFFARWLVLGLHAAALWSLGYGDLVLRLMPASASDFESLPAFVSILPVVGAWVGLIWAQYPLDRGVREQNALYAFELGEPVHAVPTRTAYLAQAVRSQVLFTLAPLFLIAVLRDAVAVGAFTAGLDRWVDVDLIATILAAGAVFILAPELLRRVLPTQPLPASPLRDRLEELSSRLRLGVRDILLWHTYHTMGNAAVMGVVPGIRYVMITDLLVETMTEDQLEAVFAHEAGHVAHRHIAWYVAFWAGMMCVFSGLEHAANAMAETGRTGEADAAVWAINTIGVILALVLFGSLSRLFERQADLFAARRLDRDGFADLPRRVGAKVFASALTHVARLNNLPLDARSFTAGRPFIGRLLGRLTHYAATWLHGSIRSRIDHLATLSENPAAARRFDRKMVGVRWAVAVGLLVSITALVSATRGG